jgi:hypothetical protein
MTWWTASCNLLLQIPLNCSSLGIMVVCFLLIFMIWLKFVKKSDFMLCYIGRDNLKSYSFCFLGISV